MEEERGEIASHAGVDGWRAAETSVVESQMLGRASQGYDELLQFLPRIGHGRLDGQAEEGSFNPTHLPALNRQRTKRFVSCPDLNLEFCTNGNRSVADYFPASRGNVYYCARPFLRSVYVGNSQSDRKTSITAGDEAADTGS